ncbi:MAG: InlB B-repeat-containing protein [Treponema sp.]|jgi:hypothetical protein|nr:InlB B-repeat-containing protein [Treponema sp.]
MKKRSVFMAGILSLMLVFGFALTGCNPDGSGGGGDTTYTVSFAPNGGGGTAPSPLSGKSGDQIILPGQDNMTAPSATPFFKGWRTPNGIDYPPGAGYTITTGNVVLFAQWGTATTNYTVTFVFGRGSGTAPSPQSVASGTNIDLPGQGAMIAPSGETFRGWSASTGGQTYNAGQSYPVTGNVTLTAQWGTGSSSTTYTVTFALGGGGGTAPSPQSAAPGANIILPNQGAMTAPDGTPVFEGWNAGTQTYAAGEAYSVPNNDITLTAQWGTNTTTFTVTFALGGGGGTMPDSKNNIASGVNITLPGQGDMTPPAGKTFDGWRAGNGTPYAAAASVTINADTTFTAQWKDAFTVTFALGGGTGTVPSPQSAESGITITLPGQGSMTPPTGKTFLEGWKVGTVGTQIYAPGYSYLVTGSVTLTAQWGPTYTVTFNRGDGGGTAPGNLVVDPGDSITLPGQGDMTPPAGKTFDGWKAGSGATQAAGASVTINANTTYTAQWKNISSGKLVEFMNGKASDLGLKEAISVDEFLAEGGFTWEEFGTLGAELYVNNNRVTSGSATIRPTDTVRIMVPEGFGEYTADEVIAEATWGEFTTLAAFRQAGGKLYVNGKEVTSGSATVKITDDVDFDWPEDGPQGLYSVTFSSGEGSGTPPEIRVVGPGTSVILPGQGNMTAPAGKTFDGWRAGNGMTYAAGASVTINTNTAFTAQWKASGGGEGTVGDISGSWTGYVNSSSVTLIFDSGSWGASGSAPSEWGYYTMSGNTATLYNTNLEAGYIGTATVTSAGTMVLVLIGGYYPGTYQFTRSGSSDGGQTGNGDGSVDSALVASWHYSQEDAEIGRDAHFEIAADGSFIGNTGMGNDLIKVTASGGRITATTTAGETAVEIGAASYVVSGTRLSFSNASGIFVPLYNGAVLLGGYYYKSSGSNGGGGQTGNSDDPEPVPPPQGGDSDLVVYMSGKASEEFGLKGPMSVSEFMSAGGIISWDDFIAEGCELYINDSRVTLGSATIWPTDMVRIMVPAGFGGASSGVQANRLRFSFRGAAAQRLRKPWGFSRKIR